MAIEAPLSRYKRTNFYIYIGVCLAAAVVFGYDGYLSKYPWSQRRKFYEEHTRTMLFRAGVAAEDLDRGSITPELRLGFEEAKSPLSDAAVLSTEEPGHKWTIADGEGQYALAREQAEVAIFKVGPNGTMLFNMISPFFFVGAASLLGARFWVQRKVKLVADEKELVVSGRERIPYDAIDSIDKTYYKEKGFFTVVYRVDGREMRRTLNDRDYDNLGPVLDHLVAQIS